jgi:hypothetical protein
MTHPPDEDLLSLADGELPAGAAASAREHVARCRECAARLQRFERVSWDVHAAYRFMALRQGAARMIAAIAITGLAVYWVGSTASSPFPRLAAAGLQMRDLPVRHLTPGAVWAVTAADVCASTREDIAIPAMVRRVVLRNYGAADLSDHEYELDYLVTPALGGAADPQNLWPERYASPTWNAYVKDELEDLLRRMVCQGALPLASAQRDMATNWIAAYKRYFHTSRPGGWPASIPRPVPLLE